MSLKDSQELKQLQSREIKLSTELKHLSEDAVSTASKLSSGKGKLASIKEEIRNLEQKNITPVVSEHAVIRYLERVKGLNIELIKQEILTEKIVEQFKTLGNGKYPIQGKHKAIIKGGTVVSVI